MLLNIDGPEQPHLDGRAGGLVADEGGGGGGGGMVCGGGCMSCWQLLDRTPLPRFPAAMATAPLKASARQ